MADASRFDFAEHLSFARPLEIDLNHLKRFTCGDGDGGTCLYCVSLPEIQTMSSRRPRRATTPQWTVRPKCFESSERKQRCCRKSNTWRPRRSLVAVSFPE